MDSAATTDREIIVHQPGTPRDVPPVLFVHGAWHGAWCWDEHFLPYFARHGYHGAALSLRHHGASGGPGTLRRCRIRDYVKDVSDVARSFNRPPIVIGHSMGGLVVQKYLEASVAPAGVLLASVPVHGAIWAALRTARRIPWQFLKANLKLRLYPLVETPRLAREAFFRPGIDSAALLRYFGLIQDESYLAFLDMLLSLPRPARITTPMLVLGGEHDAIFAPREIHATAAAYKTHATLFGATAHDLMLEPDWQSVADTILEWLRSRGL